MLEIKKLNTEDAEKLSEMAIKSLFEDFPDYTLKTKEHQKESIFGINRLKNRLSSQSEEIWGAFISDKLVGYMIFSKPDAGVIQISWVAVDKDYQNRGIGKELIEKLKGYAIEKGVHGLHLYSADYSRDFYTKLGFEDVGIVPNGYYGLSDHYMVCKLQDPKEENYLRFD